MPKMKVWNGTTWIEMDAKNADTAGKLNTGRDIALSGDATGSINFDGSKDVTIPVTLKNSGVTAGTYPKVTVDSKGVVTSGASLAAADIPALDTSKITTGTIATARLPVASTTAAGISQLNDATNSTSTTQAATANAVKKAFDLANSKANTSHTHSLSDITDAGTAASKNVGTSSGNVPILDAGGKLDSSILPAIAITDTFVVNSEAEMLALTAQTGDVAVRSDLKKSFILKTGVASAIANWQELLTPTDSVLSVNGKTGAVTINSSDVGLGNVTNESKATMFASPSFTGVPTAPTAAASTNTTQVATTAFVQTGLNTKANSTHSHAISDVTGLQAALDDKVDDSEVSTTAAANKLLKLNASSKLPASITGNADGNAATATKLQTARSISITGDATGTATFDGSANASITTTLANSGVTAGTYSSVTVDAKGRVTSGSSLAVNDIPTNGLDADSVDGIHFAVGTITPVSPAVNMVWFDLN